MPPDSGSVRQVDVTLLVLLAEAESSRLFAGALWEAAKEAADFYALPGGWTFPQASREPLRIRPSIETQVLSAASTAGVPAEAVIRDDGALERILAEAAISKGLVRQSLLGPLVHEQYGLRGSSVVLTDIAIEPPTEWRYIIWDATPNGAVISSAPLDPGYWATAVEASERVTTVKSRARAAAVCVIGSMMGLRRCQNERCFMFANIDSVVRLDNLDTIGSEHEIPELSERRLAATPPR